MNEEIIEESNLQKEATDAQKTPVFKKVVAWICIIILASMYVTSLVLAICGYGITSNLLMGCILGTLIVPILGFIIIWLYSRYNDLHAPGDPHTK